MFQALESRVDQLIIAYKLPSISEVKKMFHTRSDLCQIQIEQLSFCYVGITLSEEAQLFAGYLDCWSDYDYTLMLLYKCIHARKIKMRRNRLHSNNNVFTMILVSTTAYKRFTTTQVIIWQSMEINVQFIMHVFKCTVNNRVCFSSWVRQKQL